MLVSQDLNGDGQTEQVLYNFIVAESQVYGLKEGKWTQKAFARLPDGFSKTQLLRAIAGQSVRLSSQSLARYHC
ncbi:membrane protein [Salmonella enterica subsp. arizonae]|uniref:Membrane protein n=1 Tax=Salmonella enterica subsp. arizonae TaxID=59203 RepID=A0A2X4TIH6_SALER|nr:membrane protein [Salmonella enterica subsp. arizonae]